MGPKETMKMRSEVRWAKRAWTSDERYPPDIGGLRVFIPFAVCMYVYEYCSIGYLYALCQERHISHVALAGISLRKHPMELNI